MIERLLTAAYHSERVASRRLAARLSIPEADALARVLEEKAGPAGLAALLAEREAGQSADAARRAAKAAARLDALAARKAARDTDPTRWNAWFDGSAKPNPGPCSIGALLTGPAGQVVEISRHAGHGSSSDAEYLALIAVLDAARASGATGLVVYGDSRVVIDDLSGNPSPSLRAYRDQALKLAQQVGATFQWIPRHRNHRADKLARVNDKMAG